MVWVESKMLRDIRVVKEVNDNMGKLHDRGS